mmetsp:Transcript_358/g.344  ORF Transcript_358/g.344 Transcript_358/m.344 type:complete len:298 (-) Transcript_358:78-971(-)
MEKVDTTETKIYSLPENKGALYELKTNPTDIQEMIKLKYIKKTKVSHNTFIFSYEFANKDIPLGLNIGQHIAIDADMISEEFPEGEPVTRKYTPISWIEQRGTVDILIKVYYTNERFPGGGKMSNYLNNLKEGQDIDVRGPFGKFNYLGDGLCKIQIKFKPVTYREHKFKKIGMLGAGTGITPLFQVLQSADRNKDLCEFVLFFGNTTEEDILLKEELQAFEKNKNFKLTLVFMLSKPSDGWKGEIGHFNTENIKKYMPEPSEDSIILHCGPRSLCKDVYQANLIKLGHKKENIFEF